MYSPSKKAPKPSGIRLRIRQGQTLSKLDVDPAHQPTVAGYGDVPDRRFLKPQSLQLVRGNPDLVLARGYAGHHIVVVSPADAGADDLTCLIPDLDEHAADLASAIALLQMHGAFDLTGLKHGNIDPGDGAWTRNQLHALQPGKPVRILQRLGHHGDVRVLQGRKTRQVGDAPGVRLHRGSAAVRDLRVLRSPAASPDQNGSLVTSPQPQAEIRLGPRVLRGGRISNDRYAGPLPWNKRDGLLQSVHACPRIALKYRATGPTVAASPVAGWEPR